MRQQRPRSTKALVLSGALSTRDGKPIQSRHDILMDHVLYKTMNSITQAPNTTLPVCHIFVDSSNVNVREANVRGLSAIAHRGFGAVHTATVVGTTAAPSDRAKLWADLGYDATFTVRAPGQPESCYNVDPTLVSWVYRAMCQYKHQRSTIVLVTGDGNDNDGKPSFAEVVRHALEADWNVKLVCLNANAVYYALRREFPRSLVIERITQAMITAATANPVGAAVGPRKALASVVPPAGKKPSPSRPTTSRRSDSASSGTAELAVERVPVARPAAFAVHGGGAARLAVMRAPVARPVVVAGPRAAALTEADVLVRMIDQALSSGCSSFCASVSSGHATFTRR